MRSVKEKKELVIFETGDKAVQLSVPVENEMVWLSANQMAALFDRDEKPSENTLIMSFLNQRSRRRATRKKCVLMV